MVVRDILEGVEVQRMMRSCPPTVPSTISIAELVHEHLMSTDDHAFPVVQGGRLVGLVTLEDVRSRPRDQWEETLVREIMTPAEELVTIAPETDMDLSGTFFLTCTRASSVPSWKRPIRKRSTCPIPPRRCF